MKSHAMLRLTMLAVFSFLPAVVSAQRSDRGTNIGTSRIGNGVRSYTQQGNPIALTQGNGFKTLTVHEGSRDIEIVVYVDGRIRVKITRQFEQDDLGTLIRRAPELREHVESFPKASGNKQVELSVRLTSTFEGRDQVELRQKDLAAFGLYKRFEQELSRAPSGPGGRGNGPTLFNRLPSQRKIGPALPPRFGNEPPNQEPAGSKPTGDGRGGPQRAEQGGGVRY